jgi:hypothetical protein
MDKDIEFTSFKIIFVEGNIKVKHIIDGIKCKYIPVTGRGGL